MCVLGAVGAVAAVAGCTSSSGDPADASPRDAPFPDEITVISYPCPIIASLSAAPSAIDRDAQAMVSVDTMVPDGGMLFWTASSGSFADAGATSTWFSCALLGTVTLTATVTYQLCTYSQSVMVDCR